MSAAQRILNFGIFIAGVVLANSLLNIALDDPWHSLWWNLGCGFIFGLTYARLPRRYQWA